MGFLDDLFTVSGKFVSKAGNKLMSYKDDAMRLTPEQIANRMEHMSSWEFAAYGTALKEKYQAMSYNQQDKFLDYLISKNYTKAYNAVKDL